MSQTKYNSAVKIIHRNLLDINDFPQIVDTGLKQIAKSKGLGITTYLTANQWDTISKGVHRGKSFGDTQKENVKRLMLIPHGSEIEDHYEDSYIRFLVRKNRPLIQVLKSFIFANTKLRFTVAQSTVDEMREAAIRLQEYQIKYSDRDELVRDSCILFAHTIIERFKQKAGTINDLRDALKILRIADRSIREINEYRKSIRIHEEIYEYLPTILKSDFVYLQGLRIRLRARILDGSAYILESKGSWTDPKTINLIDNLANLSDDIISEKGKVEEAFGGALRGTVYMIRAIRIFLETNEFMHFESAIQKVFEIDRQDGSPFEWYQISLESYALVALKCDRLDEFCWAVEEHHRHAYLNRNYLDRRLDVMRKIICNQTLMSA